MDEIETIKALILDAGPESVEVAKSLLTYLYVSMAIEALGVVVMGLVLVLGGKYFIDKMTDDINGR